MGLEPLLEHRRTRPKAVFVDDVDNVEMWMRGERPRLAARPVRPAVTSRVMIYTLTMNPSLDVDLVVDELIPDDSNRVKQHRVYPGGKGLNVSRVVKEMGGATMALTFLGGHAGDTVGSLLRAGEIPFEAIEVTGETRTNVFVTDRKNSTVTRINQRGETLTDRAIRLLVDKLDLLDLRKVSYLVLGGSLPGDTSKDLYIKGIAQLNAKRDPCKILLDADGDTLMKSLEAKPAIIKPNTHEASRALGRKVETLEEVVDAAKEFRSMGVETVVVSMGSRGAVVASEDGIWKANAPKVTEVSAVGAGDSFIGGFLSTLSLGLDAGAALKRACAAGAATALTPGTELCHASDIHRLVERVTLERIE